MSKKRKRKASSDSGMNDERNHQLFIQSCWPKLAAIAYKHFIELGRGVIFLDLKRARNVELNAWVANATYLPSGEKLRAKLACLCADVEAIEQAALGYDPEREVAIVAELPSGRVVGYVVEHAPPQPSPPDAFLATVPHRPAGGKQASAQATLN